jgi:NAD(P)-dependent dehydrogenase (short-subunit alcohol dehydrogenase family)
MKILDKLFSIKGKLIIVLGGGCLIGFELSRVCALAGAKVCIADYNIRVNVLSPSGVLNNQDEDFIKEYSKLIPLKRMANLEVYSGAIINMVSNSSSYLTGSNIIIDGGRPAW